MDDIITRFLIREMLQIPSQAFPLFLSDLLTGVKQCIALLFGSERSRPECLSERVTLLGILAAAAILFRG